MQNYRKEVIRRSRLIMPANNNKFIEKAYMRNADAIVLDLEDSVANADKSNARRNLKESIDLVSRGGSTVIVRVNNNEELIRKDIEAAICKNLDSIYLPKVETSAELDDVDFLLSELEEENGLEIGKIKIGIIIESVQGYLNLSNIIRNKQRVDTITLGVEDFTTDLGMKLTDSTKQSLINPMMNILLISKAQNKIPLGLIGSIADYGDVVSLEKNAKNSFHHGFLGASCIHPSNVEILNKSFSPSEEDIYHSQEVILKFEESLSKGKASTSVQGKMIDYVHYGNAKNLIERSERIKSFEKYKSLKRYENQRGEI